MGLEGGGGGRRAGDGGDGGMGLRLHPEVAEELVFAAIFDQPPREGGTGGGVDGVRWLAAQLRSEEQKDPLSEETLDHPPRDRGPAGGTSLLAGTGGITCELPISKDVQPAVLNAGADVGLMGRG